MKDTQNTRHEPPEQRIVVDGRTFTASELEYVGQHVGDWRRMIRGGGLRTRYLVITFVAGLLLYVTADLVDEGILGLPAELRHDLIADFLYNLGTTLWASVILVLLLDVLPREQQRRTENYLRAYEKARIQLGQDVPAADRSGDDAGEIGPRLDALTQSIERLQAEVADLRGR